jgi:hypothetical protein
MTPPDRSPSPRRPSTPPSVAPAKPPPPSAPRETGDKNAEPKGKDPWIEQWLADEEDDVWNMPCTD